MLEKLTEADYRALGMLSQSDIKVLHQKTGQEWAHYKQNGVTPTPCMLRGTTVHAAALEGTRAIFESEYAVDRWPSETGEPRTKKGYKEYKLGLLATGKQMIKEEDIAQIEGMLASVERDFGRLLKQGTPEISCFDHDFEGVKAKGMLDFLAPQHFIFDLKTTSKPPTDRQVFKWLHHDLWMVQAAYYHDLIFAETGESRFFVFLIVQDQAPFMTRRVLIEPESDAMQQGREVYLNAIATYKSYLELGEKLPGYPMYKMLEKERERAKS